MISISLNSQIIPLEDVKRYPKTNEKIQLSGATLISSKMDITIDNSNPQKYDDRYEGSLFYGVDWYNAPAVITDGDEVIWNGRIKNITLDERSRSLTITTTNFIKDMADTPCIISSDNDITWAELILIILQLNGYMELSSADLLLSSFTSAIAYQETVQAYGKINFTRNDNKNVLPVLDEICRMTQCHIYSQNNRIGLFQWTAWDGKIGYSIDENNMLAGSYKHYFVEDQIKNDASIGYDSDGVALFTSSIDPESVTKYGTKLFNVPDRNLESTTSADYKLLFRNSTGAQWASDLAIERFSGLIKMCEFTLDDSRTYIQINDQIDLNEDSVFYNEPVRVVERVHDRDRRTVAISAEFLNIPTRYYERDETPPEPVEIVGLFRIDDDSIMVKWTASIESDHVGYLLYFSTSTGDWLTESSRSGPSPNDIKNPPLTLDGYCYHILTGMSRTGYYVKIKSYDSSNNKSLDSNVEFIDWYSSPFSSNAYMIQGDLYSGLQVAINNPLSGVSPPERIHYDEINYDEGNYEITGQYESSLIFFQSGISAINLVCTAPLGMVYARWREYSGGEFGLWNNRENLTANHRIEILDVQGIQLQFVFRTPNWNDGDSVLIYSIERTA